MFSVIGSDCCCAEGIPGHFIRTHVSRKETREKLEKYREQLENEIAGVEERIKELKNQ
jgi:hypothetical protein